MENLLQCKYKLKIIKYNEFNKKSVNSEENNYIIFQSFFIYTYMK